MYVRIALTAALNPSAVEGTRIIFSPLIWAESQIWHVARDYDKEARVSVSPDT